MTKLEKLIEFIRDNNKILVNHKFHIETNGYVDPIRISSLPYGNTPIRKFYKINAYTILDIGLNFKLGTAVLTKFPGNEVIDSNYELLTSLLQAEIEEEARKIALMLELKNSKLMQNKAACLLQNHLNKISDKNE